MLHPRTYLTALLTSFVVAPLAVLTPLAAAADTTPPPNWVQSAAQGPSPREGSYMAYDSARNRTVLFGGALQTSTAVTYYGDTWEFDGAIWTQINVAGPPAGAIGQMVYDPVRGVSVLFGGGDATGPLANITWEWNGSVWTARFTTHRPPGRVWQGMTYDSARHVVVMFGGSGLLGDTWEYDGSDWRQVTTVHSPSPRYGLALAYDSIRGRTVLFGGHDNTTGRLNDTWEYDGGDWTQISIATPPAVRFWHSMSFVPPLGKVLMFGGDYFVPGVTLGPNNETWLYDGATWQQLATAGAPGPRAMAPVAWDGAHNSLVLFGGTVEVGAVQSLGDTWAFVVPQSAATLSPSSLQFPTEPVLSTTSQDVTLTNTGTAPLAVSSIAATGDFATVDNCPRAPSTVAVSGSCTITVKFTPTSGDVPSTGTLTVTDNAPGGAQTIPLSGSGTWGGSVSAIPNPIDFGTSPINPSGATASVKATITAAGAATILSGFSATSVFGVTNVDCPVGAQLAAGTSCSVTVVFAPSLPGTYSGQLVVHDSEPGLQHSIAVTGTANPLPVSIALQVTPVSSAVPTFGHGIQVKAQTNAGSGSATFTFNGVQIGVPQPINTSGISTQTFSLDDTTIPQGAGTYQVIVSVHPTDILHSDNTASAAVTVAQAPEQLAWTGTGLAVAGTPAALSATVTPPGNETQFDFTNHQVWLRFDVTDGAGNVSAYFARVGSDGTAAVNSAGLASGAYSVRARLVAASGSGSPNAFVTSEDLRAALAAQPTHGGFIAGAGQQIGFEFEPGSTPTGSLVWITRVQVTGADGVPHDAFRIITSTSVTSLGSHSHVATATGNAAIAVVDATTGAVYSAANSTFQVTVAADGSVALTAGGFSASLPPGAGVNHL